MPRLLWAALMMALVTESMGCATPNVRALWPERRPLGKNFQTFNPLQQPDVAISSPVPLEEPTGVLTLRQALALALLQNPALASAAWEVRAGEARTLQAGLLPNPEISVEVENFAGSGEFRGLDAAETTIAQRMLFEARGRYVEAQTAYHRAGAEMERLIGESLEAVTVPPVPR